MQHFLNAPAPDNLIYQAYDVTYIYTANYPISLQINAVKDFVSGYLYCLNQIHSSLQIDRVANMPSLINKLTRQN